MYSATLTLPVLVSTAPEPGNWTPVLDKTTVAGSSYSGPAQVATFTFSVLPEQLGFVNNWLVSNVVAKMEAAAVAEGVKTLRVRLWRDTGPTFSTPYLCELTLSNPTTLAQGAALAAIPAIILAIIGVALAAILVWLVIKPLISSVIDIIYGPPGAGGTRTPWYQSLLLPAAIIVGIVLLSGKGKK